MRPRSLTALLLPALLAGLAGCLEGDAPAAEATGQIDGAVVDHLLRPFANETVFLNQLGRTDQTSALGGFTFRDVPVGSYTLLAAHEGTQGVAVVVDVEQDRITKVILQLMPTPQQDPRILIMPQQSGFENFTWAHLECQSCARDVRLEPGERPAEVSLQWHWDSSTLGEHGDDEMLFEVVDEKGDLLFRQEASQSPFTATIDGADIPADARQLSIRAWFGPGFTPRANFHLDSYVTVYYGATSDQMFG